MWIVELALRRPFTIAVFSILIFLMGFLCLREVCPSTYFPLSTFQLSVSCGLILVCRRRIWSAELFC